MKKLVKKVVNKLKEVLNSGKGFTLLELLVVVLIIGILAAIALPQYKLAVEKSRLAQVLAATKSITQAQEIFYMTNGRYTNNIADLDIDITVPKGWSMILLNNSTHEIEFVRHYDKNNHITIISYYNNCGTPCLYPGRIYCWAGKNDKFGQKLCQSAARTQGYSGDGGVRWIF